MLLGGGGIERSWRGYGIGQRRVCGVEDGVRTEGPWRNKRWPWSLTRQIPLAMKSSAALEGLRKEYSRIHALAIYKDRISNKIPLPLVPHNFSKNTSQLSNPHISRPLQNHIIIQIHRAIRIKPMPQSPNRIREIPPAHLLARPYQKHHTAPLIISFAHAHKPCHAVAVDEDVALRGDVAFFGAVAIEEGCVVTEGYYYLRAWDAVVCGVTGEGVPGWEV